MAAVKTDENVFNSIERFLTYFQPSESPQSSFDDGFKYIAGRRYLEPIAQFSSRFHANPDVQTYILPNDVAEHARLDKLQFMISSIYGGNVLPPICKNPRRILDCGTGSGVFLCWCH